MKHYSDIHNLMKNHNNNLEGNSGDIEYLMVTLADLYQRKVQEELKELKERHEKFAADHPEFNAQMEYNNELLGIVGRNRSQWSGGFSIKNLCEQIRRETALDAIRR